MRIPCFAFSALLFLSACVPTPEVCGPGCVEGPPPADPAPEGDLCGGAAGAPVVVPLTASGARVSGVPNTDGYQFVEADVEVPAGCWSHAEARFVVRATCKGSPPSGQNWPTDCDPFDRLATLTRADPDEVQLMLLDAATPFGGDAEWTEDVTDLLPALTGRHRFRATVTAGADPKGLAAGTRAGWNVEASLVLTPGPPERHALGTTALAFVPRLAPAATAPMGVAAPPPGATLVRVDVHASGHGAVGAGVCDEFCQKTLEVQVAGRHALAEPIWKSCADNCEVAAGSAQCMGQTFAYRCANHPTGCPASVTFDRAGWCPGQKIPRRSFTFALESVPGSPSVSAAVLALEGYYAVALSATYF